MEGLGRGRGEGEGTLVPFVWAPMKSTFNTHANLLLCWTLVWALLHKKPGEVLLAFVRPQ